MYLDATQIVCAGQGMEEEQVVCKILSFRPASLPYQLQPLVFKVKAKFRMYWSGDKRQMCLPILPPSLHISCYR